MTTVSSTSSASTSVNASTQQQLLDSIAESMAFHSGRGSSQYVIQTLLSKHDRFGSAAIQLNSEMVGLTFFTKPRLNMSTSSIRQDPSLVMMDTLDPLSLMFSLRCNLDTVFSQRSDIKSIVAGSPFFNSASPFNVPMGNMLSGISGFPDFNIEYETTESGYFSEDMTLARGSDWGRRTYNLSCTFRDIQGGYMMAYFYYWLIAMALQMEGAIVAYSDDRQANRLNYTCSIYRFILDPSMTTIVKWAKATGCYPVSLPIGDVFNFSPGESYIHAAQQFTVPFVANNIRYMDPRHLAQFNTLVNRYAGSDVTAGRTKAPVAAASNFAGIPYVDLKTGNNELQWWATSDELADPSATTISSLVSSITAQLSANNTSTTPTNTTIPTASAATPTYSLNTQTSLA